MIAFLKRMVMFDIGFVVGAIGGGISTAISMLSMGFVF